MPSPRYNSHGLAKHLIGLAAPLVPRRFREDWRREWIAELDALRDTGRTAPSATRRALGAFVDALWIRQRDLADFDWIDDVRHGWRQLSDHLAFALTAVGILGIGLGATVTMFSVIDQVLLRPLPYPEADRIVTVWETRADRSERLEVAPANFLDWRARAGSFEHLAAVDPWSLDFKGGSRPEPFFSAKVTPGFFESFGVRPVLGRFFLPDEFQEGRDRVLVLGETFWRQRFGADPTIVGRNLSFEEGPHEVIGIVPASFEPRLMSTASGFRDVWAPKALEGWEERVRTANFWQVVGRLKPNVSLETARAELDAIARQLALEYPTSNQNAEADIIPLREHLVGNVRLAVALLTGAVALVLLIACVNIVNLLLARGASRERELAIRAALGARRSRLVRQLLTESLLIAVLSGMVGTLLAYWSLAGLARLGPASIPWIGTLHLDLRALTFAGIVTSLVALLAGALPAWRAAFFGLATAGRATATADAGQHRLRAGLVVAEVALALVLVSGAGLLIRSFTSLLTIDPGFERRQVLAVQVFTQDHNPTPAQRRTFFERAAGRLASLPTVQSVGIVSAMPFIESNINIQSEFAIAGRPAPPPGDASRAHFTMASPGYFETMRIPLRSGRLLDDRDGPDAPPVAVISEELVRRHWAPGEDPLGDRIRGQLFGREGEVEIVGVVASLRHDTLDTPPREEVFIPHAQLPFGSMTFVIRSAGDAASLIEPAKAAIWEINPAQTIYRTATVDELVMKTVSPRRFALAVLVAFALIALLLAAGGVYGVLSAIAAARTREIGVRLALGASRGQVMRWLLGRGLTIAGLGVAIGVAGALGAGRLLRGFLFEVAPSDPWSLAAAAALMLAAACVACYLPVRRASAADPVTVLRAE